MAVLSTVKAIHSQEIVNGEFSTQTMDSYLVRHSEEVMASLTVPLSPVPPAPLYRGATGTVLPKKKSPNPVEGKLATA